MIGVVNCGAQSGCMEPPYNKKRSGGNDRYPSLVAMFAESCERFAGSPAYSNMGRTISYADLDRLSLQFASWLQQVAGLRKGDRIALMMPNLLQYPIAVFGALRAGLAIVNTNPLYTHRELAHQLNDSGATAIVILENFAPKG